MMVADAVTDCHFRKPHIMTQTSPLLALPYLQPSQAQKHITHNEALQILDAVVQLGVTSRSVGSPPTAPTTGERFVLPGGAAGDWSTQAVGTLAVWQGTGWIFVQPQAGWLAYVADEDVLSLYDGVAWTSPKIDLQNLSGLGIGATSDAINRLSVASDATLLSHAGTDHRIVVNKAAAGNTASLLFQSNWSGRAEMGLAGDDSFRLKVSDDAVTYHTALETDAGTGKVSFPNRAALSETVTTTQGSYVKFACGTMTAQLKIAMGRGDEFGNGTLSSMYRTNFVDVAFDVPFIAPPTIGLSLECPEVSGLHKCLSLSYREVTALMINDLQGFRTTTGNFDMTAHVVAQGRWY